MKKFIYFYLCLLVFILGGCQFSDDDYQKASTIHTLEMDLESAKKYMHIDSAAHQYTIAITDEQQEAEGISKENLAKIFKIVTELNQRIDNDFNAGKIVTMYLTTKENFISYTIDPLHQLHDINFKDVRTKQPYIATRAGKWLYSGYFMDGNWERGTRDPDFKTSASHVTSELDICYARGAWNFGMTCLTGKSAYGTSFSTNGIGHTYGGIQRYWWWTGGGSAPFNWKFTLGGPLGGEANGGISIYES